ncbi:MAG TPA: ABC-F family ATP-binding cassette domain-containing protein [Clostridia bacterium]|nr:ABC-F family ATP-binding cassette domain-containing protein [Clostridia bacterium]
MNLYFENLDKSFNGNKVLENISGKISSGDKIGLIGINGIGKTTLAKILSGAESVEKGQVVIPLSLRILYLEQDPRFDQKTTVYDELYKTSLKNTSSQAPSHLIKKALNTVGLPEKIWKQPASSLSGGEKTKLLLARLVVSDFDFLLLDESTNHLDIETCQRLEDYLSQLNKTMLIISHDRFFLDQIVHKIWELTPEGLKVFKAITATIKSRRKSK